MTDEAPFTSDWASPPGETVSDLLVARQMSTKQFASRLGANLQDVERLLSGESQITPELATRLHALLGLTSKFWLNRETRYRAKLEYLAKITRSAESEWLGQLPVKDMIDFGWIDSHLASSNPLLACLQFFNVPNVVAWQAKYTECVRAAAFRTSPSFASNEGAVSAWLRYGELKSAEVNCSTWNPEQFRNVLSNIRALTRQKNPEVFLPALSNLCASCGVVVVIARSPQGCRASGATRFLSDTKALIMLSFRYLSDDQFWFSFFHEAAHLILHQHCLFLESDGSPSTKEEREANAFAAETLIPKTFEDALSNLPLDAIKVIQFARHVGVSPGIVVGQLQHRELIQRNHLNRLKRRFVWLND